MKKFIVADAIRENKLVGLHYEIVQLQGRDGGPEAVAATFTKEMADTICRLLNSGAVFTKEMADTINRLKQSITD